VLLIFCFVENRSPGALDNASGLSTLIGVAASDRDHDDVAYLITDAEELGLVGSRAIARQLQPVIGVINIDGIDDEGGFYILERFGIPPRHIAPHLAAAIMTAATEMGEPAQRRTVPFGLLLDHMPLARVQLPAVTLMRGSMRSLLRVHLPTDSLAALNGVGIDSAIALVRRSLEILRGGAPAGSV
jgi:Zn-dependent M28 family amino/carboxypeptidase